MSEDRSQWRVSFSRTGLLLLASWRGREVEQEEERMGGSAQPLAPVTAGSCVFILYQLRLGRLVGL